MLPDVQIECSNIQIPIQQVGITDLKLPIYIDMKSGGQQHTVADIDVFVNLKADQKGTHMSRLTIGLQKFMNQKLNQRVLTDITKHIIEITESESCRLKYKFPYFLSKTAPISKEPGVIHHNIIFELNTIKTKDEFKTNFYITVDNIVTSLCPCSKKLASENGGAHNQRNIITVKCKVDDFVWIEDIIDATNKCGSCQVYSVLKRTDEKFVTEEAYNNPSFVEDIVRKAYIEIKKIKGISYFDVTTTSQESIHQHGATAKIESNLIDNDNIGSTYD